MVYVTSSVDGKIASRTGDSRLSCPHDLRRLHEVRASCDAVIVGANTVIRDDPSLTVRYVRGSNPIRVVIDGMLRSPLNAKLFTDGQARTVVYTSVLSPRGKVNELRKRGVDVYVLEPMNSSGTLSLTKVLEHLYEVVGARKVLVEGGGTLLWYFFKERLVDEVRITVSPYVIGGEEAISVVEGEGFSSREEWVKLRLKNVKLCECGNEVHIIYEVVRKRMIRELP
ncbi:MAG: 2,5-diamino-6-(ribosylamino)-4(3H)-pyrimidinone 5'-phosphate reductase [Desulfurococcales archaeon ex4484_42]|nr:MAG: 2,5-diamino-6-(ribosylamino)-4(3H)-pyrimidinone 5'-phosphate reductase [Desulfurococcales archaeon ex4484_42]